MGNSVSSPAGNPPTRETKSSQPSPPTAQTTSSSLSSLSTPSTPPSSPPPSIIAAAAAAAAAAETSPATSDAAASEPPKWYGTPPVLHNGALVVSALAPIALLMPGRGRSMGTVQNALLGGGAYWGFNQLAHDYTGKSIWVRSSERWGSVLGNSNSSGSSSDRKSSVSSRSSNSGSGSSSSSNNSSKAGFLDPLPPAARERRAAMEAERARREAALPEAERTRLEQQRRDKEAQRERERRGLFGLLWPSKETQTPEWNQRRAEEDRKAIESGKGIGDLMMEQIREVLVEKPDDQTGKKNGGGEQGGGSEAQNRRK